MKLLFALAFTAATTWGAAIEGVVLNGTSGQPQGGATVTLYKVGGPNGPEAVESVKTTSTGKFSIDKEFPGPRLLQAAYNGVTYNHMLPPGAPSNAVTIDVYEASKKQGLAHIGQHAMILEPVNGQLTVSEIFVWQNDGKTTFYDPDKGSPDFYLPPATGGKAEVNVLAPQGMPIRRAPEKTGKPDVYKVDFAIKPGQSRVDLSYQIPFTSPGDFEGKVLYKDAGATQIVVPQGVTLSGEGVKSLGAGPPNTNTVIYGVESQSFKVNIAGSGTLRDNPNESGGDQNAGPSIAQIMPRLFHAGSPNATFLETVGSVGWIIATTFGILALGFSLLYRAGSGVSAREAVKAKSGRDRG